MTLHYERTNSENPHFKELEARLDAELLDIYGEKQKPYTPLNKLVYLDTVVIAYSGSTPVGCGCYKPYNNYAAEVKRMFVDQSYRGKGIARGILAELERWAKENEYSKIILETGIKQQAAMSLYKSAGYKSVKNYAPYENMKESLCFEKLLVDLDL